MPPAKSRLVHEDSRSEGSTVRERQIAAAAHARKSKIGASSVAHQNGSALKELALASAESANLVAQGQATGVRIQPLFNTRERDLSEADDRLELDGLEHRLTRTP